MFRSANVVNSRCALLRLVGAIVLLLLANSAGAAIYCVYPGSNPSLETRLQNWMHDSSGTTTTLRLERGTYTFSGIYLDYRLPDMSPGDLDIEGGYAPDPNHTCANDSTRSKDASTTIIDGGSSHRFEIIFNTNVKLAVLEFLNFKGTQGVTIDSFGSGDLVFDHIIAVAPNIVELRGGSNAIVKDVLVFGQPAPANAPALAIASYSGSPSVTNVTVANNGAGGLLLGDGTADAQIEAFNLIAWHNASFDVDTVAPGFSWPIIYSSIIGTEGNGNVTWYDVQSVDPMFVHEWDQSTADYHLTISGGTVSPAVNTGTSAVVNGLPVTDIAGNARVIGGAPDMGAYEMNTPYHKTFVVTTNADNGSDAAPTTNSLRWALKMARADALASLSGTRKLQIAFNLACPKTIVLAAPLHAIDFDVTIDATTNPGWVANTNALPGFNAKLCVGVNGSDTIANAFHVVTGGRATVKGMRFGGFTDAAIRIDDTAGNLIHGNQIGGGGLGTFNLFGSNKNGVRISGTASGNFVGAFDDPSTRNMISDNTGAGVYIDSAPAGAAAPNYVANNLIGLASDGKNAYANGDGVLAYFSPGNVIEYNTIGASTKSGITLYGSTTQSNLIEYNLIGLGEVDGTDVSNGTYGVFVASAAANNTIGAPQAQTGGGNSIYADGTAVYIDSSAGVGNRVLANAITTGGGLGIDLGVLGPTANDANLDADSGPNRLQNFPVVLGAWRTPTQILIEGTLDSSANDAFRLDFYWMCCAGAAGRGMPDLYLGRASVVTDAVGHGHFLVALPSPALIYPEISFGAISATATDVAGDTSEPGVVGTESSDQIFANGFDGP